MPLPRHEQPLDHDGPGVPERVTIVSMRRSATPAVALCTGSPSSLDGPSGLVSGVLGLTGEGDILGWSSPGLGDRRRPGISCHNCETDHGPVAEPDQPDPDRLSVRWAVITISAAGLGVPVGYASGFAAGLNTAALVARHGTLTR